MVRSRHTIQSKFAAVWRYTGIFFSAIAGILLWMYAVILIFVWYGARLTPESAVLVRIASSILSDLVWIPLGFTVWSGVITWILGYLFKAKSLPWQILAKTATVSFIVVFFICCLETAFAFLFVPLSLFIIRLIFIFKSHRLPKLAFIRCLPLCFVIVLTVFYYRGQLLPTVSLRVEPGDIKIMGYNIFAYADYDDRMKVFETIKNESPDVICFMEFNPLRDPELFKQKLGDRYPYMLIGDNLTRWTKSAAFILSRFPIKKITVEKISEKENRFFNFIFAEMNVDGRTVNIVNYHLLTVGHRIARAARENLNSSERVTGAVIKEAAIDSEKYDQAHFILDKISTFSEPTILCGDLNDTPNSRAYHLLDRYFINTFSEKGWGLGPTFGKAWMRSHLRIIPGISFIARDVMRIDHIFASRDFTVVSSRVIADAEGSDHKPIISVLRLNRD